MNMGCEFFADALLERAAGVLEPERSARLDAHLADCEECGEALRTIAALKAAPLEVPAGLEDRVRSAVREAARPVAPERAGGVISPQRRWRGRWRPWAVPLAAAAAAVGIWLGVQAPDTSDVDQAPDLVAFEEYDPYGDWPADGLFIADQPVLSELSVEELEYLLRELES